MLLQLFFKSGQQHNIVRHEVVEVLIVERRLTMAEDGVFSNDLMRLGELSVDPGELVDRGSYPEAGDVCRQELLVEGVIEDIGFTLLLLPVGVATTAIISASAGAGAVLTVMIGSRGVVRGARLLVLVLGGVKPLVVNSSSSRRGVEPGSGGGGGGGGGIFFFLFLVGEDGTEDGGGGERMVVVGGVAMVRGEVEGRRNIRVEMVLVVLECH